MPIDYKLIDSSTGNRRSLDVVLKDVQEHEAVLQAYYQGRRDGKLREVVEAALGESKSNSFATVVTVWADHSTHLEELFADVTPADLSKASEATRNSFDEIKKAYAAQLKDPVFIDFQLRSLASGVKDLSDAMGISQNPAAPELQNKLSILHKTQQLMASHLANYNPAQTKALSVIWKQLGGIDGWQKPSGVAAPVSYEDSQRVANLLAKDVLDQADVLAKNIHDNLNHPSGAQLQHLDNLFKRQASMHLDLPIPGNGAQKSNATQAWNRLDWIRNGMPPTTAEKKTAAETVEKTIMEIAQDAKTLSETVAEHDDQKFLAEDQETLSALQVRQKDLMKEIAAPVYGQAQKDAANMVNNLVARLHASRNAEVDSIYDEDLENVNKALRGQLPSANSAAPSATAGNTGGTGGGNNPPAPSTTVARPPRTPARDWGDLLSDGWDGVTDLGSKANHALDVQGNDSVTQAFNGAGSWIGDFASNTFSLLKKTFNGMSKGGKGLLGGVAGLFAVPWAVNQLLPMIGMGWVQKVPFLGTVIAGLAMWFGAKGLYKLAYENSDDPVTLPLNEYDHVPVGWVNPDKVGQQGGNHALAAEDTVPTQTHDGQNVFSFSLNRKKPSSAYNLFTADQRKMVNLFEDLNNQPVFAGTTGGNNHRGNLIVFPALPTGNNSLELVDHDNSGRMLTFKPRVQTPLMAPVKFNSFLAPTGTESPSPEGF